MEFKYVVCIFISICLVFSILNFAFADDAPSYSKTQARAIAQDYLNTHGYTNYQAVSTDNLMIKVHDNVTDKIIWVSWGEAKSDSPDFGGPGRYDKWLTNRAWQVNVLNPNGNYAGRIYVDGDSGKIISVKVKKTGSSSKEETITPTTTTNNSNQTTNKTETQEGIFQTLQNIINDIILFFQQLMASITGS